MTVHSASREIEKLDKASPDYLFRVQAIIKRLVHCEKQSVYQLYSWYAKDISVGHKMSWKSYFKRLWSAMKTRVYQENSHNKWIRERLTEADQNHREWMMKPDEEIITWSVATHKYVQKIEPCSVCGEELTGKPYSRLVANGTNKTFCVMHSGSQMPKEEE